MNEVQIITDSTSDLSKDILDKYNISSLPLYVRFNNELFQDGIDISTDELYEKVKITKELPKTAAVAPGDFIKEFKTHVNNNKDVVYIGIGSKISGTIQSSLIAKNEFPKNRVHVVNTKNLSSGIGLLVLIAKDLKKQGLSALEIKTKIDELVPKVRTQFAIRILDYLHKGGRASGTAALVGTMLRMRPIIQVRGGNLDVYKKPMGTMRKAINIMLNDMYAHGNNLNLDYIMITHTKAKKQLKFMRDSINNKLDVLNLVESEAGCVISSHCGPGTVGLVYLVNE